MTPALGGNAARRGRFWAQCQRWMEGRVFRVSLLAVVAITTGMFLAPSLGKRSYPVAIELLNTPSTSNIRSPVDLDVVDHVATQALQVEAVSRALRVYDLDLQIWQQLRAKLRQAFAKARSRLAEPEPVDPLVGEGDAAAAVLDAAQQTPAHQEAYADFARELELEEPPPSDALMRLLTYSIELETHFVQSLKKIQSEPVVARRSDFGDSSNNAIWMQPVPMGETPRVRVGDLSKVRDLNQAQRAWSQLWEDAPIVRSSSVRRAWDRWGQALLHPNLTHNRAATEETRRQAEAAVAPVVMAIKRGEMIVRDGDKITARHQMVFRAMGEVVGGGALGARMLGAALMILTLILAMFSLSTRSKHYRLAGRDILLLASFFLLTLGAGRLALTVARVLAERFPHLPMEALWALFPVAVLAMVVRLVLRVEVALLTAVVTSFALGWMAKDVPLAAFFALVGSVLGATSIGALNSRGDLLRAGLRVGIGQTLAAFGIVLFQGEAGGWVALWMLPAALISGVVSGFLTLALTPVVETVFGYTTDLKLLELASLNHPALKELIVQAPGSYHHSIIVGSLAEAAAEAVGANSLKARVMAYYHDLGKGCNPSYFIENQRGDNPHNRLKPSMSAMIIRRHVTDGLEIARRYGLGEIILAAIAEHHGTTLIQYFYHRASESGQEDERIEESEYRYPGRKPQTRESALVMLADSVEAACRSLTDHSPSRLKGMVSRIINNKFTDGQLEECDLTLRDLHTIAASFLRVLTSIYHQRVAYPDFAQEGGQGGKGSTKGSSGRKKAHADSDSGGSPSSAPSAEHAEDQEPRREDLRRLGAPES